VGPTQRGGWGRGWGLGSGELIGATKPTKGGQGGGCSRAIISEGYGGWEGTGRGV